LTLPRLGVAAQPVNLGDPRPLARLAKQWLEAGILEARHFNAGESVADWIEDAWEARVNTIFEPLLLEAELLFECDPHGQGQIVFNATQPSSVDATAFYTDLETLCPGAGKGLLEILGDLEGPMPILTPSKAAEAMDFLGGQHEGWLPTGYDELHALPRAELEALANGSRPLIEPLFVEVGVASLERLRNVLETLAEVEAQLEGWDWHAHRMHDGGSWVPGYVVGVTGPHGDLAWHAARELTQYAFDATGVEVAWSSEVAEDVTACTTNIAEFLNRAPRLFNALERLLILLGNVAEVPLEGDENEEDG
jgi:hypothetical protein